ncbi:MAG: MFS transporter, partial [Bacillota bacterium]|nr:MFS transporter [Bacillota bacterium]
GIGPTFLIDAAAYLPFILGLLLMRGLPQPRQDGRKVGEQVMEGLRYVAATPQVFWPIALVGAVSLLSINWNVLLPLFAKNVLNLGPDGLGLLYGALGIGSLAGSLHMARDSRAFTTGRVALYAILFTAFEALAAIPNHVWWVMACLVVAGYYSIRFTAGSNAYVQITVPDYLRVRVMSVYYLVFGGSSPFGNELVGGMAHYAGPKGALLLSGLLGGLFSLWVFWRWRRHMHGETASGAG